MNLTVLDFRASVEVEILSVPLSLLLLCTSTSLFALLSSHGRLIIIIVCSSNPYHLEVFKMGGKPSKPVKQWADSPFKLIESPLAKLGVSHPPLLNSLPR